MFAIASGYEDGDDCDTLRHDPIFKMTAGHEWAERADAKMRPPTSATDSVIALSSSRNLGPGNGLSERHSAVGLRRGIYSSGGWFEYQNARIITQNNKTPGDPDGCPTRG